MCVSLTTWCVVVSRDTRRTGCTNNAVEGWHRGFATNLGAYHPNFWRYLDILKREQCLSKAKLTQLISGQGSPAPRRQYRDAGARLLTVVNDYEHTCIIRGGILGFCPPGILYPGILSSWDFVRLDIVLWVFVHWINRYVIHHLPNHWTANILFCLRYVLFLYLNFRPYSFMW